MMDEGRGTEGGRDDGWTIDGWRDGWMDDRWKDGRREG